MLVLRPRIELDDSSKWFYGSTMTSRVTHGTSPMEFADLVPLVHAPEYGTGLHFLWNRYKIIYDIVIIVDTYNKQINIANDLKNRLNIIKRREIISSDVFWFTPKPTLVWLFPKIIIIIPTLVLLLLKIIEQKPMLVL